MRYFEIADKYALNRAEVAKLEGEYKDKKKGDLYQKRKIQLIEKAESLQRSAKQLGTIGNICHVSGKRSRASRKTPQILVQENFNLYFVNISEEEATALTKLHIKNIVYHKITFIRPGVIITSS